MQQLGTPNRLVRAIGAGPDRGDPLLRSQLGWWVGAQGGLVVDLMGSRPGLLGSGAANARGFYPMLEYDGGANGYTDLGSAALIDKDTPFTLSWVERVRVAGAAMGLFVFCPSGTTQKFIVLRDDSNVDYRYLTASICNQAAGNIPRWNVSAMAMSGRLDQDVTFMLIGYAGMGASVGTTNFKLFMGLTELTGTFAGNNLGSFTGTTNLIGWDSIDNKFQGAIGAVRLWGRALGEKELFRVLGDPMAGLTAPTPFAYLRPTAAAPSSADRMFNAM